MSCLLVAHTRTHTRHRKLGCTCSCKMREGERREKDKSRKVLQNEFRYDLRKGPREFSAGTVITVLKAKMHVNTALPSVSASVAGLFMGR